MSLESNLVMRLLLVFDMPVGTKEERKVYSQFVGFLKDDGFLMLQYSVYSRLCSNDEAANMHIKRIQENKPEYGNVRIIKLTDNQFEKMIVVQGEKTPQETLDKNDDLVII